MHTSAQEKELAADSFGEIFNEWYASKSKVWSQKYADEIKRMFDDDALPVIGHMRIEEVEPMEKIPAFNEALLGYVGSIVAKIATQVLQYTAFRTIELRSMAWDHVDFENRLITVASGVMKGRREHMMPMSDQVIDLLRFIQPITGMHRLVFIGRNDQNKSLSENAILGVVRRIGYEGKASGHGFRHQFRQFLMSITGTRTQLRYN